MAVAKDKSPAQTHARTVPYNTFFYVLEGVLKVVEGARDFMLHQDDFIFLKKNIPRQEFYANNQRSRWLWIQFDDPPKEADQTLYTSPYQDILN